MMTPRRKKSTVDKSFKMKKNTKKNAPSKSPNKNSNFKKQLTVLGYKSVFEVVAMDKSSFVSANQEKFKEGFDAEQFYNWAVYIANYALQQVQAETSN